LRFFTPNEGEKLIHFSDFDFTGYGGGWDLFGVRIHPQRYRAVMQTQMPGDAP